VRTIPDRVVVVAEAAERVLVVIVFVALPVAVVVAQAVARG